MSSIEVLQQFKSTLISFIDELIDQFPAEGDLVVFRIFIQDQAIISDVVDTFLLQLESNEQEIRKMIKERDENFFLEHSMFDGAGKNKVNHFKKIWRSGQLDADDKTTVWSWVDSFVILCDRYAKTKNN